MNNCNYVYNRTFNFVLNIAPTILKQQTHQRKTLDKNKKYCIMKKTTEQLSRGQMFIACGVEGRCS